MVHSFPTRRSSDHAHAAGAFVVRHPFNLGQGAALQTGIDYALTQAAQFVVTFDADGQHRVSDISRLIEALVRERADFALGSRFLGQAPNLPPLRRLVLQAATLFTRLTTRLQEEFRRDRKSTRLNSSHTIQSRMPSSA